MENSNINIRVAITGDKRYDTVITYEMASSVKVRITALAVMKINSGQGILPDTCSELTHDE